MQNPWPLRRQIRHDGVLIKVLGVQGQKNEEGEKEATEQSEQVYPQLIAHRALIPANLTPEVSLALAKAINVVPPRRRTIRWCFSIHFQS